MAIHTVAFTDPTLKSAVPVDLPAVADQVILRQNNHFVVARDVALVAGFAAQSTIGQTIVTAPSIHVAPALLCPTNYAIGDSDPNLYVVLHDSIRLRGGEEFGVQMSTTGVETKPGVALLWLADTIEPIPSGERYWITLSNPDAQDTASGAWQMLTGMDLSQPLPSGEYAVVGFVHYGPNPCAARLVFADQTWRPGTVSISGPGARTHAIFYDGSLGVLGRFNATTPPQVETFGVLQASGIHQVVLQVVRLPESQSARPTGLVRGY